MKRSIHSISALGVLTLLSLVSIGVPSHDGLTTEQVGAPVTDIPPCIGFNPEKQTFGREEHSCPSGYAAYGVDDPAGIEGPGEFIKPVLTCCPLPSEDILNYQEQVYSNEGCPEDYVVTGTKDAHCGSECTKLVQCTKINSTRYKLGELIPAKYWGYGASGWEGAERIRRDVIPMSMRHAVGRRTVDKWDVDGCVGYPWGSLFVKKESKYCSGMYFRQLQYVGLEGDPSAGEPVKMISDCKDVEGVDNPENVRCIN